MALLPTNGIEFTESFLVIAKLDTVVVPRSWRLLADELAFILEDSGASVRVFDEAFATDDAAAQAAAAANEPVLGAADGDMRYIMYTSGTTALPSGAVHTHDTCLWALLTMNVVTDLRGGDRSLQLLPMFHVGALTPATFRVHRGATLVAARSFDARGTWALMVGERIRVMLAVPAMPNVMWQVPERDARDRSPLRWMLSGAVPVPVVLIRRYAAVGIEVHQSYGLTGTCGPACVIGAEHATSRPAPPARTSFTPASAW